MSAHAHSWVWLRYDGVRNRDFNDYYKCPVCDAQGVRHNGGMMVVIEPKEKRHDIQS